MPSDGREAYPVPDQLKPRPTDPEIARELNRLARRLQTESDPEALLRSITAAAVTEIDGADWAGVSLFEQRTRQLATHAATDPQVEAVDRIQYESHDGPCVEAARMQRTVRCEDLADEPRWPQFAGRAVSLGVRSMLSLELFSERGRFGALNLYSHRPGTFDDVAVATGLLLASHAALSLSHLRAKSSLQQALDVRDLVGQAKGILMERYGIGNQAAFELLSMSSQNTNTKLVEVAEQLIATRELRLPKPRGGS